MAIFKFIKQVLSEFSRDKVGQLSAAFAYVAIFSIGPLLLVLVSLASFIFGEQAASGELFTKLSGAIGPDAAKTLQDVVARTYQGGGGGLALAAGAIGLLLGATGLASQLQNSFDTIFGVGPDPKGGLKHTIYVKVKNVLLVIAGGLFVIISVAVSALISGLTSKVQDWSGLPPAGVEVINNLVSLSIFVMILYGIYRVLPSVHLPRKLTLVTSLIVALLFIVGKLVLAVVIGRNGTAGAYGAAASLVTLLLWVYYSGQILLLGAEGLKVYAREHGMKLRPKR
jgi:membrane protein